MSSANSNWKKLQSIFEKAVSIPVSVRDDYLNEACGSDKELKEEVMKLLKADESNADSKTAPYSIKLGNLDSKLIGTTIDGWKIKKLIGVGGMGNVFLAEKNTADFEQQAAFKIVKKGMDSENVINRFRQERQILASLNHPNIARMIDGGVTEDGRPYFVMELVNGLPIIEHCDAKKLGITQRLGLFQKACDAVHYAHKNLIVHRDLKPSNIIITENGDLKLLDFGIAKILDDTENAQLTQTGMQLHTPAYASPEQLTGDVITTASDIYALGILLYELLTGRKPFEVCRTHKEYIELVLTKEPTKPSEAVYEWTILKDNIKTIQDISRNRNVRTEKLQRTLIGDLDVICLTAIQREPERRYTSSSDLSADISRHLNGLPVLALADSAFYRFKKLVKRNIPASLISVLAIGTIITISVFYTIELKKQRDLAVVEREKAEYVVDFVTGLFEISDPSESKGENISARDLLDAGAIQIETELSDQPAIQYTLQRVLGEVYYKIGSEEQAKELLRKTLISQKTLLGDNHLDVATTQLALGLIYQDRGKFEEAEALFNDTFNTQKQLIQDDDFALVETLNILAFLEQMKGNFDKSESLFVEALDMAQRLTKSDNEYVSETLKNLGGINRILYRNDKAEVLLREALAMQLRLYEGGTHTEIDDTKRELAGLLRDTRRFEEAKTLYLEIIASRTKMLGEDHLEVAHVWNSFSHLLSDMDDKEGAINANQTFIDIMNRAYPGPHPSLGAAYHNRALLLKDNNMLDEAVRHFNLSIDMQDATNLPQGHTNRTYPLAGMGGVYLSKKEFLKAKEIFNKVLVIRRDAFSESHILITEAKSNLAAALTGLEEYDEAETLLVDCYQQFINTREANDPRTERAARRLLHLYTVAGTEAKKIAFDAILEKDGVVIPK